MRSSVTGPQLPRLHSRAMFVELTIAMTAQYLRRVWPSELEGVRFEVSAHALDATGGGVRRWQVFHAERRVVFFRTPIERLARLHRNDELHRRMFVESCVFRAVAELLGKDPWELAPERFRHF